MGGLRRARDELGREIDRVREFVRGGGSGDAPAMGGFLGRMFVFSSRLVADEELSDEESEEETVGEEKKGTKEERKAQRKAKKRAKKEKARLAAERAAASRTKEAVRAVLLSALRRTCGLDAQAEREAAVSKAVSKHLKRCLQADGRLKWKRVFAEDGSDSLPVKLEICSGSGEWAAAQAAAEAGRARWGAMELRHDRVYDCFSRMVTGRLRNLAVLGGDAHQILQASVAQESVAHICVNFPEPPCAPLRLCPGSLTC